MRRAIRLNRRYGKRLGWDAQYDRIEPFLGFTDISPDEKTFAQAVNDWQRSQGLKADGIIGLGTWRRMRVALGVSPAPADVPQEAPPLGPRMAE